MKARHLKLQQEQALRWFDPHFSPDPALAVNIRAFCDIDGCEYINGIPSSLPAAVIKARRSVLSFYHQALRPLSDRAAATAFIRTRAAAHRRWISARSRPVPVSPTPKRWLRGQLKFLTQQSPTGPGKLREDQIRNLIAPDGIKPRTAALPPTVPAQDRHPWAGFPASIAL